ncbi:MAG: CRISPR-associated endonuclease Csn1 [Kosmotogales bacterium]|nr:CRISPR-associated endonuclease Csn1 [Kosmotogales bacterium]
MSYILGLDIGFTSVGWAVIDLDKKRIEDLGVRLFNGVENNKGETLAAERRNARGARRRIRRKAARMRKIKELFVQRELITEEELENLYLLGPDDLSPWKLREEGLRRKLNNKEWARVLTHIAKHRGFKSNRKSNEEDDKESGKLTKGAGQLKRMLCEKNYETVGEMISKDEQFCERKRNTTGDYSKTILRSLHEEEINILFENQKKLGNIYTGDEFKEEYLDIMLFQKPYASKEQIEKMVGRCTFFKDELRAPRNSFTAEYFRLLQLINNLRIINTTKEEKLRKLTAEERDIVKENAFKTRKLTYKRLRKELNLEDEDKFNINKKAKKDKDIENDTFIELKGYHSLKKAIPGGIWNELLERPEKIDEIACALTLRKTDEDIREYLEEKGFEGEVIESVLCVNLSGHSNLSLKALRMLIPHMENGKSYDEACSLAGIDFSNPDEKTENYKLPVIDFEKYQLTNPVVKRSLSQVRKVVNAVIDKYGSPARVHIELARDLVKSFEKRREIEKIQKGNRAENERATEEIKELANSSKVSRDDIIKYNLWKQQDNKCAYSLKPIDIQRLFESGYAEVDHILPYSRTFDDSFDNKVLVFASENQNKGNKTPYEYFGQDDERWSKYINWVNSRKFNNRKKLNLLKKKLSPEETSEFKARNLNDTRYITRYIMKYINNNLKFSDSIWQRKVIAINGWVTSKLRYMWGLTKNREESDLHHALDASIIAATTEGLINKISYHYGKLDSRYHRDKLGENLLKIYAEMPEKELKKNLTRIGINDDELQNFTKDKLPEIIFDMNNENLNDALFSLNLFEKFPQPWEHFREELKARLSDDPRQRINLLNLDSYDEEKLSELKPVFVSRMPIRKISGKVHGETVYSRKRNIKIKTDKGEKGYIEKIPMEKLKPEKLEAMYDRDNNKKLYEALKKKLEENDGDEKKAFKEPFYKPTNDGTRGPRVKSVKILTKGVKTESIEINNGFAENAKNSLKRVDVFEKSGKYYLVPIYKKDIIKDKLPERAIAANKSEEFWDIMDESYDFKFSIFYNDLLQINKKGEKIFGYFVGLDRKTGSVSIIKHDKSSIVERPGVKTCDEFIKYYVDVLGNYHRVKKEKRKTFK